MDTGQRESSERKVGSATYRQVGEDYLAQRTLQKSAGWVMLWALGVAAVISGDFFGWNFGLATGGFGGLLVATVLMAIMYVCMVLCIAELSTALPYAGGFYAFTRSAMGPSMAFVNTVTDIVEYVVTPAVVVISIAAYADNIVDLPNWVWWVGFYALFVGINMWGTKLSFRVSFIAAILSVGVLVFFYLAAIFSGAWSPDLLNNVPVDSSRAGASTFLPLGWYGVLASFPFAIWFYLAIEQLPLAAEESNDIVKDMPKALIWGIVTLLGFSVFTLVFNTGLAGGAAEVGSSLEPVMLGFRAIFGEGVGTTFLAVLALIGLIASFHAIIYAYGRVLFAGSRAGYLPRSISVTSTRHTPARALLLGGVVGLGLAFLIDAFIDGPVGAALLNMAVMGAVISYAIVMIDFVVLRVRRPEMHRPYRSPLGIAGGVVGAVLALLALASTMLIEAYRIATIGTLIFIAAMFIYYLVYSRHHLVAQAPEEEAALVRAAQAELA